MVLWKCCDMSRRIRFIIQARLSSQRLPAKVLLPIDNKTIIEHVNERLQLIKIFNTEIIFAIAKENNTQLEDYLRKNNITYFSGSNHNVLERFINAIADLNDNDYFVRLTADNPFIDYKSLAKVIEFSLENNTDYSYMKNIPLGTACEVVKVSALRKVSSANNLLHHHKEHVTTYIKDYPSMFNIQSLDYFKLNEQEDNNKSIPLLLNKKDIQIRLTIDEQRDYLFAQKIYNYFKKQNNIFFTTESIYKLYLKEPDFFNDNLLVKQKSAKEYEKQ